MSKKANVEKNFLAILQIMRKSSLLFSCMFLRTFAIGALLEKFDHYVFAIFSPSS